jgi:hypothetical protein
MPRKAHQLQVLRLYAHNYHQLTSVSNLYFDSLDIGSLSDKNSTCNDAWQQQLANNHPLHLAVQPTTSESRLFLNLSDNTPTGNDAWQLQLANNNLFPLAVQQTTFESQPLLNINIAKKFGRKSLSPGT